MYILSATLLNLSLFGIMVIHPDFALNKQTNKTQQQQTFQMVLEVTTKVNFIKGLVAYVDLKHFDKTHSLLLSPVLWHPLVILFPFRETVQS